MKSNPNDFRDPQLGRDMQAYCESELLASERTLAKSGDCPDPREILALARGDIHLPWRREAMAKHLLFCSACSDRNLSLLFGEETELVTAPADTVLGPGRTEAVGAENARPPRVHWRRLGAAAAILLSTAIGMSGSGRVAVERPFVDVRVTDGYGLETRSVHRLRAGEARKVSIEATASGVVALGRASSSDFSWEPIEAGHWTTRTAEGEELILPMDHAVVLDEDEDWLLVEFAEGAAALDASLDQAFLARLLRGERPDGVTVTRVRFRLDL